MTAKEYLRQLKNINAEINVKYLELETLRAQVGIRAQPDPNENVGHSGNVTDPVSDIAVKIVEMEKYINRKIDRLINLRRKITTQIDGMENRNFRNLLICKYVLEMTWTKISETLNYNEDYCRKELHSAALQTFYEMYLKPRETPGKHVI